MVYFESTVLSVSNVCKIKRLAFLIQFLVTWTLISCKDNLYSLFILLGNLQMVEAFFLLKKLPKRVEVSLNLYLKLKYVNLKVLFQLAVSEVLLNQVSLRCLNKSNFLWNNFSLLMKVIFQIESSMCVWYFKQWRSNVSSYVCV